MRIQNRRRRRQQQKLSSPLDCHNERHPRLTARSSSPAVLTMRSRSSRALRTVITGNFVKGTLYPLDGAQQRPGGGRHALQVAASACERRRLSRLTVSLSRRMSFPLDGAQQRPGGGGHAFQARCARRRLLYNETHPEIVIPASRRAAAARRWWPLAPGRRGPPGHAHGSARPVSSAAACGPLSRARTVRCTCGGTPGPAPPPAPWPRSSPITANATIERASFAGLLRRDARPSNWVRPFVMLFVFVRQRRKHLVVRRPHLGAHNALAQPAAGSENVVILQAPARIVRHAEGQRASA